MKLFINKISVFFRFLNIIKYISTFCKYLAQYLFNVTKYDRKYYFTWQLWVTQVFWELNLNTGRLHSYNLSIKFSFLYILLFCNPNFFSNQKKFDFFIIELLMKASKSHFSNSFQTLTYFFKKACPAEVKKVVQPVNLVDRNYLVPSIISFKKYQYYKKLSLQTENIFWHCLKEIIDRTKYCDTKIYKI